MMHNHISEVLLRMHKAKRHRQGCSGRGNPIPHQPRPESLVAFSQIWQESAEVGLLTGWL